MDKWSVIVRMAFTMPFNKNLDLLANCLISPLATVDQLHSFHLLVRFLEQTVYGSLVVDLVFWFLPLSIHH